MADERLDLWDWCNRVASIAMFGASRTGASLESQDLWITHCGFPETTFNSAFLKDPSQRLARSIERTERYFAEIELPFSFMCRSDRVAACGEELAAAGYPKSAEVPVMTLDPIEDRGKPVEGLEIVAVDTAEGLAEFQKTAFNGFGFPEAGGALFLTPQLLALPNVRLFLGRIDGQAVCTSLVVACGPVAGIYWVATVEEQRGKGLGEAITWASVRGGGELGCRFANLQASELGAPVYARMGFATPVHYVRFQRPGD